MAGEAPNARWKLGDVVFDPADGSVWRDGRRRDLTPKALAILEVLVEAAPRMVTKEQLLDAVWPEAVVAEAALTQRMRDLREALGDDARAPRYIETVARRGYRLIAPLEPLVELGEPAPHVAQEPAAASTQPPLLGAGLWRRWVPWAAAALVALGALGAVWLRGRPARVPAAPPAAIPSPFVPRRCAAVLAPISNPAHPDAAWVGTALAEMLSAELGAGGTLRTVSPSNLAEAARELGLAAGAPTPELLRRLRALLGLDLLVTGTYTVSPPGMPPEVGLDLDILEAATGGVLASFRTRGPLAELPDLAGRAGSRLRQLCGVPALPPAQATQVRRLHPDGVEAARLFAEGTARMQAFEFTAAVAALERACAADPASVPIRAALAHALAWNGQSGRARTEMARALEHAASVPRELQLAIESDYREMAGDWQRAIEITRSLHVLYPDNLAYGLSLATLLASHGQGDEAERVLAELRQLPDPLGQDPRIDLAEAWMHETDLTAKLAAASRAAERARVLGARLLLASARIQQGRAYRGLGKPEEALAAFVEAWRLREAAGETSGVGKALRHVAAVERDQGALDGAAAHLAVAATIARRLGEVSLLAGVLRDQAALALDRGDLARAAAALDDAAAATAGRTLPEETAHLAIEAARLQVLAGSPAEAAARARAAVQASRAERLTSAEARARALLARALLASGGVEAAAVESAAATRLAAATDDRGVRLEVAIAAALVGLARADLTATGPGLEQALAESASAPVGLRLEAEAVLARLALASGRTDIARVALRDIAGRADRLGFRPLAETARRALP
ncbi:MAG TPA: winged helix-turn-helix domain-containing protein [Thermoanaerobaculaceae bacterium]|nr:winged helix-turn-helix domain-containing protein [Thermoanaerobaculaceae bacterium]HRS17279.1 winged helix-turn-helix domain-containing protein [Thermoanaerobaculaceae bacterium]